MQSRAISQIRPHNNASDASAPPPLEPSDPRTLSSSREETRAAAIGGAGDGSRAGSGGGEGEDSCAAKQHVACQVVWQYQAPISDGWGRRAFRSLGIVLRMGFFAVLAGSPGGATERSPSAGAMPFLMTFWCGPPLAEFDDARAAEVAAAGFTVVGPPCEGALDRTANLLALDAAARHGLRVWVKDNRLRAPAPDETDWEARVAAAVADYHHHPALAGYFVVDEPPASDFPSVAKVVAALHAADPKRVAYVNLLPDYVPSEDLGAASYEEYVGRFVQEVRPRLLSYDYYPFGTEKDRSTFFSSLGTVRDVALRHDLPFMLIVLAMPHANYRDPTEAELAWQVFHALAFGARGISYFAYWTPTKGAHAERMKFRFGLIEGGKPTLHYFQAARLNRELRAVAEQLTAYRSISVADSIGEIGGAFPIGPIEAVDGGAFTAGLFANERGDLAVLLVNRDYRYGATARLRLRDGAENPDAFYVAAGRWKADGNVAFSLPPGGAQLLRWQAPDGR